MLYSTLLFSFSSILLTATATRPGDSYYDLYARDFDSQLDEREIDDIVLDLQARDADPEAGNFDEYLDSYFALTRS
jgi:hypothetical protein